MMEQAACPLPKDQFLAKLIHERPGIRYSELRRLSGFQNGVLTYHLAALEKSKTIIAHRQAGLTQYFPPNIQEQESAILRYMRHGPTRQIVLHLLSNDHCTFHEIVGYTRKSPSTVSGHLKRLKESGVISVRYGEQRLYRLSNKEFVGEVFLKYRESLADRIVDNYIAAIEEL